ncbi:hypothetical protein [Thalassotalea agariperforans]
MAKKINKGFVMNNITLTLVGFIFTLLMLPTYANNSADILLDEQSIYLKYAGGFKFQPGTLGASSIAFSQGTFTVEDNDRSIYVVGNAQSQALGQFNIPKLSANHQNVDDFPVAKNIQTFFKILPKGKSLKKEKINRITGLELIDNELFINAIEYYDADANNLSTTLILRSPEKLRKSDVDGFYQLRGKAKAAGWMSKITDKPQQEKLKGNYIVGYASNPPINGRLSIGPSAYAAYLDNYTGFKSNYKQINTKEVFSYSLASPLHEDLYNKKLNNKIWTEVSKAVYGFIIPNTNKYLVLGSTGGHKFGIGYKIKESNGNVCGGPCAYKSGDYNNYFWLWDLNNLNGSNTSVVDKKLTKPIAYGNLPIHIPPKEQKNLIIGADFNPNTNRLYIMLSHTDRTSNRFEPQPIVLVYELI